MPDLPKRLNRRAYMKTGALAGVAGLAGCLGDNGDDDDGTEPVDDGDDTTDDDDDTDDELEDNLVVYASSDRPEVFEAFEDEYGVSVDPVILGGYEHVARFETEEAQGEHQADVVLGITWLYFQDDFIDHFADINLWDEHRDAIEPDLVDEMEEKAPEGTLEKIIPLERSYFAHIWGEGRLDEPLEDYHDLLRDDLEDNIIAPAFIQHTMAYTLDQLWDEEEVDDFFAELGEQGTRFVGPPTSSVTQDIIAGERDVGITLSAGSAIAPFIAEGAPIVPAGLGAMGSWTTQASVSANAPNPNAAQAFAEFIISEEAQTAQAQAGAGKDSVRAGIDHGNEAIQELLEENEVVQVIRHPEEVQYYQDKMDDILGI